MKNELPNQPTHSIQSIHLAFSREDGYKCQNYELYTSVVTESNVTGVYHDFLITVQLLNQGTEISEER
jgi:hypothetical protein